MFALLWHPGQHIFVKHKVGKGGVAREESVPNLEVVAGESVFVPAFPLPNCIRAEDSEALFISVTLNCKKVLAVKLGVPPPSVAVGDEESQCRVGAHEVHICTNAFHCKTTQWVTTTTSLDRRDH